LTTSPNYPILDYLQTSLWVGDQGFDFCRGEAGQEVQICAGFVPLVLDSIEVASFAIDCFVGLPLFLGVCAVSVAREIMVFSLKSLNLLE
jgi:hypothetical protein